VHALIKEHAQPDHLDND